MVAEQRALDLVGRGWFTTNFSYENSSSKRQKSLGHPNCCWFNMVNHPHPAVSLIQRRCKNWVFDTVLLPSGGWHITIFCREPLENYHMGDFLLPCKPIRGQSPIVAPVLWGGLGVTGFRCPRWHNDSWFTSISSGHMNSWFPR